jgi:predicted metalloendopeptidase
VSLASLDTTCSPCDDFYRHANGAWLAGTAIPPDRAAVGAQSDLTRRTEAVVRDILDSLAYAPERHARSETERKLGTFFQTCMDPTISGADELRAIGPELERIGGVASSSDLGAEIAKLHLLNRWSVFDVFEVVDEREPNVTLALFRQSRGAFFLPTTRHYLSADSSSRRVREEYSRVLVQVFTVLGQPPDSAERSATRVIELETKFAELQEEMAAEQDDRPGVTLRVSELAAHAPSIGWAAYFAEIDRPDMASVRIVDERFLPALESLVASASWTTWRPYIQWHFLIASQVSAFDGMVGAFRMSLGGAPQAPPREVRCVRMVNAFGMAIGEAYVARAFPPAARAEATELVEQLRDVLRERISTLDWMSAATKERAIAKLDAITLQIGYPDEWPDYGSLDVVPGSFARNRIAVLRFTGKEWFATLGVHPDGVVWQDYPAFPNGSYSGATNIISLTAAQLQPPFFDPEATDLANLAGIGAIIGHELTHAFDADDRQLNERGVREDWWTPDEVAEYERRAEAVVEQYDQFVVIDTIRQNGRRTLDENISDIGGLRIAYLAFLRSMERESMRTVDGYTPEQRFFLAFAQAKRSLERPDDLRQAGEDAHAAAQWRVNGPLSHLPEFAAAFGCVLGDPMVYAGGTAARIW